MKQRKRGLLLLLFAFRRGKNLAPANLKRGKKSRTQERREEEEEEEEKGEQAVYHFTHALRVCV